jgi:hypothetical protein
METKKLQIGLLGMPTDPNYTKFERIAEEVGGFMAQSGSCLLFGNFNKYSGIASAACRGAKKYGGTAICLTYGWVRDYAPEDADAVVCYSLDRGNGSDGILALSCDSLIEIVDDWKLWTPWIKREVGVPVVLIGVDQPDEQFRELCIESLDDTMCDKIYTNNNPRKAVDVANRVGYNFFLDRIVDLPQH